ncbi:MAG: FtsX-like permease family protein, partial [Bryobacteraceae bacterium]
HTTVYKEMSLVESPELFRPLAQDPPRVISIHVRMEGDQAAIGAEIQRQIAALDHELPAGETETAAFELSKALAYPRFRALVFGAFAICALLLAAVGLHGVLGQFVARRTPEFGVRMALGAQAADIFRLVARQGGLPVVAGLAAGALGSVALGRVLTSLLFGVRPTDPLTLVSGILLLLASAAVAIALPAARAARVDPMAALRDE